MALEFVGGALLSAFLDAAFDRLASPAVFDYFRVNKLDDKLLHNLKVLLLSINAVLDDADNKHYTNQNVSDWLDLVKDAVLDAEDLLDEIYTEASKSKMEAESQTPTTSSKVGNSYFTFTTSVSSFDKELPSRIHDILSNLELLTSQKDILGLEKGTGFGMGKNISQRLPATSLVDEAAVFGRNDDQKAIIDLLLPHNDNGSSGNNLSVISIVGMGGMGKTTLAQLVYNDNKVKDEFQLKAWVCISEDFDIVRVTRTILEALSLPTNDREDLNSLQVKLKEKLSGKKFLLVLDDVWEENYLMWEALQAPFVYGARGSKILVTTRSNKVASTMRCAHLHQLKRLQEEQSWLLFSKYALFDSNSTSCFEEIGRKIIKKCDGLPLALKAIGSLLYTKSTHEEWNGILTSEMWDISDGGCNIIPALRLSYQYLSSPLKRCFAYCSLIPKDYEFKKDWLVELWMAENFLQVRQQNKGMKELGDQFFNDLLLRSFFQRSSNEETEDELFVMHDLVNDLATSISRKFCLRHEKEEDLKNVSKMTRHISYYGNFLDGSKKFEAIYKASKLRTFQTFTYARIYSGMVDALLGKCKFLRVLSLDHIGLCDLPDSIGNLKHLRYLDLSFNSLKRLPESTCFLYNLQTLKMRCSNLEELPSGMHKLVNLRHLDLRGTNVRKMPNELGKLKKLEVLLISFYVGKYGESNINQLAELNLLRGKLSIKEMQNVADPLDASTANLKNKIHLQNLEFEWSTNDDGFENERDVLEKLQPPANLKELSIRNYGGTRFPCWFGDNYLVNIVSLKLIDCKYCYYLPPLGILPSLKYLLIKGLEGITRVGTEFYGNDSSSAAPFGSLQYLQFEGMDVWEEWDCENAATGAFPCLQELTIRFCHQLKNKLPQHLPSLLKLDIKFCKQLAASLPCAATIQEIKLSFCGNLQLEFPYPNTCLKTFEVWYCPNMEFQISYPLNFLLKLELTASCDTLKALSLDVFPKLQIFHLKICRNLERLDGSVTSLVDLMIWDCPKLVSLPEDMHTLFPSLKKLSLSRCPQVEWPEGGFPSSLESLVIHACPKLVASQMNWDLHNFTSLIHLVIQDENDKKVDYKGLLPPKFESLNYQEWGRR